MARTPHTISKVSPLTGKRNERVIILDKDDYDSWKAGAMIQDALPYLSADDREFLMTGYTPEDWDKLFGEE